MVEQGLQVPQESQAGQVSLEQASVSAFPPGPGHSDPWRHSRRRFRNPMPHVTLHWPHVVHGVHTGQGAFVQGRWAKASPGDQSSLFG